MNSYTAQGDRKRALTSLRTSYSQKTHHFSSFRTGIALGLAFPAFVDGIVRSTSSPFFHTATEALQGFQDRTRAALPAWGSLLYIYAIFLVPTLFAFLVGTDLLIWNASRINYVFIFGKDLATFRHSYLIHRSEFDVRTRLDHREYFEVSHGTVRPIERMLMSTICRYLAFYYQPSA
jgi:hypothetical protein